MYAFLDFATIDRNCCAVSISSAEVACVAPAVVAPGRVNVKLAWSDSKEIVGEFEYKMYLKIDRVHPAVVDVDGGTTVTAFFQLPHGDVASAGNVSCKFGDSLVPALCP